MTMERLLRLAVALMLVAGAGAALYSLAPFLFFCVGLVGVFALFAYGVNRLAHWYRSTHHTS